MKETIFLNGDIITMEDNMYAEALFIKNGLIYKVGTKEDVFLYKSANTEIIDLNGKTLMPAFVDAHSHITAFANTLRLVPLNEAQSIQDVIKRLQAFKKTKKLVSGEWIIGFGYDQNNFLGKHILTKNDLDQVSTVNPIIISHASGHMGVVNSLGLQKLNINKETPNPDGGRIGRIKESDEPNGYLEENAFIHNSSKIPQPSQEKMLQLLDEAQNIYFSYGITTAQDGMVNNNEDQLLKAMSDQKRLRIDVVGYIDLKNSKDIIQDRKAYIGQYVNHYKIGGYKIFLDGSPQGRTAWLSKPYENATDNYCGYPVYKDSEVEQFIETALNEEMQLLAHCNGDAAAEQLITCFEKKLKEHSSIKDIRPVMIHAQTVRYDQLDKMKKIHMIPSFFINHTYYWGDVHIQNLGLERAERISPVQTTIKKGITYTLHQDTPVVPPDMFHSIWCAVNRITKKGITLGKNEKISPLDAIKGVTQNSAYQYFEENEKGSIKEGKQANFIIIDSNPLTIEPMKIKDIQVLETIKNGISVYKKW